jgi:homocitrate synthase
MAIVNAYTALKAGTTHINVCELPTFPGSQITQMLTKMKLLVVLGIGKRVGITPLGGLVVCLYAANPEYVKSKKLAMLREVENLVAEAVEVNVPFMNPITYVHLPCATVNQS